MNLVVGIGGTLRRGSSSELLAREVLRRCEADGARVRMFDGPFLARLPHYDPGTRELSRAEADLVEAVREADGLVIASPGYHGGVSGLVKNAIDLLEELREDKRPYFEGRPVGLVVSAAGWQAGGVTLAALRGIVHAMRGWPTPMGIAINSLEQKVFDATGGVIDGSIDGALGIMAEQIGSRLCIDRVDA
jgi:FMN reductase